MVYLWLVFFVVCVFVLFFFFLSGRDAVTQRVEMSLISLVFLAISWLLNHSCTFTLFKCVYLSNRLR